MPQEFRPSPIAAEAYRAPSREAMRLVRSAAWLTSPPDGRSSLGGRVSLQVLIAPMTQLTFLSFDLQAFLFLVFHRRPLAVWGHGLFMTTANLCMIAALRGVPIAGGVDAGLVYALVVAGWYGAVAFQARLRGWFAAIVPALAGLYLLAGPLARAFAGTLHASPLWGYLASALLVALSHAAEPHLPPRTVDPYRWVSLESYLLGPGLGWATRLRRLGHIAVILVVGVAGEAWASLRLMPYNWLMWLMRAGYARARRDELRALADRAWASGQPAIDFVGSGGGTFLAPTARR